MKYICPEAGKRDICKNYVCLHIEPHEFKKNECNYDWCYKERIEICKPYRPIDIIGDLEDL